MRLKDKEEAVQLRLAGKSYSQIKDILKISKSTLSDWLKDYPLSKSQISLLHKSEGRIEKYRRTRQAQKENRLRLIESEETPKFISLLKKETFLLGYFLYWGEGAKTNYTSLSVTNTDPSVIVFFIKWLTDNFGVPRDRFQVYLHLYRDMNINKAISFWSKRIDIPRKQFYKPYIKSSSLKNLTRKGGFGYGSCSIKVGDARLAERVLIGIKIIREYFGA